MNMSVSSDLPVWSHQQELRERNKTLRTIYEAEGGMDYGGDVVDQDELSQRLKTALTLRRKRIADVLKRSVKARNLDLCFLVDVTRSMAPHIAAVKEQIRSIVNKLTDKDGEEAPIVDDGEEATIDDGKKTLVDDDDDTEILNKDDDENKPIQDTKRPAATSVLQKVFI
jgi:hypothetical protein